MSALLRHPSSARLRRYVLHEADAVERLVVEAHLPGCARCRAFVEEQARLDQWLIESCPLPDRPAAARAAFDRLWGEVDAEAAGAADGARAARDGAGREDEAATAPRAPALRRAAAGLLALAAGLLAVLWGVGRTDPAPAPPGPAPDVVAVSPPAPGAPAAREAGAASAAEAPGAAPSPHETAAGAEARAPDPADALDPARLRAARAALADALRSAQAGYPEDAARFGAACGAEVARLRADGWPVHHLLRGLAQGDDATLTGAALRYAAQDPACSATLVDALARPPWDAIALTHLAAQPLPAPGWPSSLVAALAALAAGDAPVRADALRLQAAALLARDGRPGASEALARTFERTLERAPPEAGAHGLLAGLARTCPPALACGVLLARGTRPPTDALAAACFATLAREAPEPWGLALGEALGSASVAQVAVGARWAAAAGLRAAAPALGLALRADPGNDTVLEALTALGGPGAALALWDARRAAAGGPGEAALRAAVVACVRDEAAAAAAVGAATVAADVPALRAVAEALPAGQRGPLLLAGLAALPDRAAEAWAREELLTALARLGTPADAPALLAWIDGRAAGDRALPLAWTTAACLAASEASAAWARQGRDPARLAAAADARGAWPAAAPSPPARTLRALERTLRAPLAAPPPAPRPARDRHRAGDARALPDDTPLPAAPAPLETR